MPRENISDILVFIAIARERSFTRAAAKLGMTQSALSHIIRGLEVRLGVRLLIRTTRSVSPTEAGERLLQNVAPRLEEIETEIKAVTDLSDKPAGTVRIAAVDHVVQTILWPRLKFMLLEYPNLNVELNSESGMVDIAAESYDIGVRYGDQVGKDMIAVRLTDDIPMAIVSSPDYFALHSMPSLPQDLLRQNCVTVRLASTGGLNTWQLKHDEVEHEIRVRGQVVCSNAYHMLNAALDGCGLAFLPEDMVRTHVHEGRLVRVMEQWCPRFPSLYAYYSRRRHSSRAVALVIDAIRYKG